MNTRTSMTLLWILAGLTLLAGLSWMVFQFSLPRSEWVELGLLTDYPPSKEPYHLQGQAAVFLVNDGTELVVLDPLNRAPGGVLVRWVSQEQAFIDPSRGSRFDLHGLPTRNLAGTSALETEGLRRYPVKVENGVIFMDLNGDLVPPDDER